MDYKGIFVSPWKATDCNPFALEALSLLFGIAEGGGCVESILFLPNTCTCWHLFTVLQHCFTSTYIWIVLLAKIAYDKLNTDQRIPVVDVYMCSGMLGCKTVINYHNSRLEFISINQYVVYISACIAKSRHTSMYWTRWDHNQQLQYKRIHSSYHWAAN